MSRDQGKYSRTHRADGVAGGCREIPRHWVRKQRPFWSASLLGTVVLAMLALFLSVPGSNPFNDVAEVDESSRVIERTLARTLRESRVGAEMPIVEAPPNAKIPRVRLTSPAASEPAGRTPPEGFQFVSHHGSMKRAPLAGSKPLELSPNPRWLDPSVAWGLLLRKAEDANRDWAFAAIRLAVPDIPFQQLSRSLSPLGVRLEGISGEYARARVPANHSTLEAINGLPQVLGIGAMPGELKVVPEFARKASSLPAGELVPVFITLMADDPTAEWRMWLADLGVIAGPYDPDLRSYTANMPYGALPFLVEADFVMAVEPVAVIRATHDTAVPVMGADALREYQIATGQFTGITGNGVPVGILDTGLNTRHIDIHTGRTSICGTNIVNQEQADLWIDRNGHGTLVTATLVGAGKDRPELAGMAPNASHIRFAKVLDTIGRGTSDDIRRGMSFMATPSGCRWGGQASDLIMPLIVNMSLATASIQYSGRGVEERKLDSVVYGSGQLYVVAQANAGSLAFSNYGTAKNSLAVGAVDDAGIIADFSSHGPTADGRLAPKLVGTGVVVTSAAGRGRPSGYSTASGTSFASPSVAGVAALLMEAEPAFRKQPALARARLMASAIRPDVFLEGADEFPRNNTDGPGTLQNQYGLGLASTRTSILSRDTEDGWVLGSATSEPAGGTYEYVDIQVPEGASRLDIVMTWDEQAADTLTSTVVNNLDLWVDEGADCMEEPCGEHASQSVRDNIEWLFIDNPTPGTHRVKVVPKKLYGERVEAAVAWTLIRGSATPQLDVQVDQESVIYTVGDDFEIVVTVSVDQYLASGTTLHLGCRGEDCFDVFYGLSGDSTVLREDGIARSLNSIYRSSTHALFEKSFSLGEIAAGDARQMRVRFSSKHRASEVQLQFTATAWNARSAIAHSMLNTSDEHSESTGTSSSQDGDDESPAVVGMPPANDDFVNAIELEGLEGSAQLDLLPASREPGEPGVQANSRTAWYSWTAPRDGLFRFRLKRADRDVAEEVNIDVYTGEHLTSLKRVEGKLGSELTLVAERGLVYKLRIRKAVSRLQELLMQWEPADHRPFNDDFAFAQQISGDQGKVQSTNEGATLEKSEFWEGLATTVWYEWTAPSNGYWWFGTAEGVNRVLAFSGDTLSSLRFIGDPPTDKRIQFPAGAGEVYRIAVASSDADASGSPFELAWYADGEYQPNSFAENDGFSNAEILEGVQGRVDSSGRLGLTVEPLEPLQTGIATAWWRWTAPENGTYTWRYGDSTVLQLTVLTGENIDTLSTVASGARSAPVTFEATAGTRYHLALGHSWQAINREILLPDIEWGKTPQNNDRDDAVKVFGVSGSAVGSVKYATSEPHEPPDTWGEESVWWQWSAPSSGWYRFWVEKNPVSEILSLYPMNPVGASSTRAQASSERTFLLNGRVEAHLLARAGDAYEIRLSHRSGLERIDTSTLRWEETDPPVLLRYAGAVTNQSLGISPAPLRDPWNLVMHPDGGHLFVNAYGRLLGFARNPETGALTLASRFDADSEQANDVSPYYISQSGLFWDPVLSRLFTLSPRPYVFEFQPEHSGLLYSGEGTLLGGVSTDHLKVAANPARRDLYLLVYRRGPLQVVRLGSERKVTLFQTIKERDASGDHELLIPSMRAPKDIAVSQDGSHVYVATEDELNIFSVDADTGRLALVRRILAGPDEADTPFEGMGKLHNLVLDRSGRYLFVTGEVSLRAAIFDLSEDSSNPSFIDSVTGSFRDESGRSFWGQTMIPARAARGCWVRQVSWQSHSGRCAMPIWFLFGLVG